MSKTLFYLLEIGSRRRCRGSFIKVSGQTVSNVYFFRGFVKLVYDIGQKAASGSQHTISDVSGKFLFGFWKVF